MEHLAALLRRRAEADPNALLLACGAHRWTALELLECCTALAGELSQLRAQNDSLAVSIASPRRLALVIWAAALAEVDITFLPANSPVPTSQKAGGIYVRQALLTDSRDVARSDSANLLRNVDISVTELDIEAPVVSARDRSAAFVFQTSGTEGQPKAIRCEHWKFVRVIESMIAAGALRHGNRGTAFISQPLNHSYGLCTFLEYCAAGASIALPSETTALGPIGDLFGGSVAESVEAVEGVPYFWSQFARLINRVSLPKLRHVGLGGGRPTPEILKKILSVFPEVSISVRYGLTETPSVATHKVYHPPHAQNEQWSSSGMPIPAYEIEISGGAGQIAAPDTEGEVVVLGSCVSEPSGRLRTGDMGYLTAGGELVITGRKSAFIKRRGYRISPEVVEAAAANLRGVDDCRAVGSGELLVLEVVGEANRAPSDLISDLRGRLPDEMLPDQIVFVKDIPRTYSGKIRRT